jgi:exonuclease SbcD
MKFIHFADAHIGVESVGGIDPKTGINVRVLDYLDTLDALIDFACEEDVDLVVFAGDAFHTNKPNPVYLNEFSKRILRLKEQCPLVLLVGNHDGVKKNSSSAVEIYNSLQVEGITVGSSMKTVIIDTKAGKVQVTTIPYPNKDEIEVLPEQLKSISKKIDKNLPSILLGHFSVRQAITGSESFYAMKAIADIDLEDIALPAYDYVALGHIHKHQDLSTGRKDIPPTVYSGSIERVTFNEEHEEKGFVLGEISNKETSWEFIGLDSRQYRTIEVVNESGNPTKKMLNKISKLDLKGAIVRYIIHLGEEYVPLVNDPEIHNAIMEAGAFAITSRKIDVVKTAQRLDRSEEFSINSTPTELLEKYLVMRELSPKELDKTIKVAKDIMEEVEL